MGASMLPRVDFTFSWNRTTWPFRFLADRRIARTMPSTLDEMMLINLFCGSHQAMGEK